MLSCLPPTTHNLALALGAFWHPRHLFVAVQALQQLLGYTTAPVGGFYDHLGSSPRDGRLSRPEFDSQFVFAPLVQFSEDSTLWPPCGSCGAGNGPVQRVAWHTWAQTYGDAPLTLRYLIEPCLRYRVLLVYAYQGWSSYPLQRLVAYALDAEGAATGPGSSYTTTCQRPCHCARWSLTSRPTPPRKLPHWRSSAASPLARRRGAMAAAVSFRRSGSSRWRSEVIKSFLRAIHAKTGGAGGENEGYAFWPPTQLEHTSSPPLFLCLFFFD